MTLWKKKKNLFLWEFSRRSLKKNYFMHIRALRN